MAIAERRAGDHAEESGALRPRADSYLAALAGLYLMLYAPFVAGVQIILYVGGIMVLFLFVIMLVNIEQHAKRKAVQQAMAGGIAGGGVCSGALLVAIYVKGQALFPQPVVRLPEDGEHPAGRQDALQGLHVALRDCIAAAAGGDHRRGGDGEEEDLT